MALSKLSEKCKKCPYVETCEHKRMEMLGYLEPASAESMQPLMKDMLVKHDYQDIKIDTNTTVTIDLEEINRKITEEFYKSAGFSFFMEG